MQNVVLDIWAGEAHQNHVARRLCTLDDALILARYEIEDGYLVNIRTENTWGPEQEFDTRHTSKSTTLQ